MGHASTRITERVYARIKDEDLAARAIYAMDPSYARRARKAHGAKPRVKTITAIPAPRRTQVTYDVNGEQRTLTQWAHVAGIPKTTLHHRVVEVGMPMTEAIALGGGHRGKALLVATKRTKPESGRRRAARRAG